MRMEFSYIWLMGSGLVLLVSFIGEIKTRRERKIDIVDRGINE